MTVDSGDEGAASVHAESHCFPRDASSTGPSGPLDLRTRAPDSGDFDSRVSRTLVPAQALTLPRCLACSEIRILAPHDSPDSGRCKRPKRATCLGGWRLAASVMEDAMSLTPPTPPRVHPLMRRLVQHYPSTPPRLQEVQTIWPVRPRHNHGRLQVTGSRKRRET